METESIALATGHARARLNLLLIECVQTDWETGGADVVAWLRKDRPLEYLKLVRLAMMTDDAPGGSSTAPSKIRKLWSLMFAHYDKPGRPPGAILK